MNKIILWNGYLAFIRSIVNFARTIRKSFQISNSRESTTYFQFLMTSYWRENETTRGAFKFIRQVKAPTGNTWNRDF